jgi:hypothetical protein
VMDVSIYSSPVNIPIVERHHFSAIDGRVPGRDSSCHEFVARQGE